MFEYAQNRFVAAHRIIGANVYTKDGTIRVAIDIDTEKTGETCVYSNGMATIQDAVSYILKMPVK